MTHPLSKEEKVSGRSAKKKNIQYDLNQAAQNSNLQVSMWTAPFVLSLFGQHIKHGPFQCDYLDGGSSEKASAPTPSSLTPGAAGSQRAWRCFQAIYRPLPAPPLNFLTFWFSVAVQLDQFSSQLKEHLLGSPADLLGNWKLTICWRWPSHKEREVVLGTESITLPQAPRVTNSDFHKVRGVPGTRLARTIYHSPPSSVTGF